MTPEHAECQRSNLVNHILPYFGKKRLTAIKTGDIEKWILHLKENTSLSDSTINHCLKTLKVMLNEAERLGRIDVAPTRRVANIVEENRKRGILTLQEARELFNENRIEELWDNNIYHFTCNMVAASTGRRQGEILALKNKFVHEQYIEIKHSYGRLSKLKSTKTKDTSDVPIPRKTSFYLQRIKGENPEGYVFALEDDSRPYSGKAATLALYKALKRIGIGEEERKRRNIDFHSWRHFFNNICRARNIPDSKIQSVIGHKTMKMTENYTTFNIDDYMEIVKVQEELFQGE